MHPLSCGFSPTHDPPQAGTKREARHLGGSIAPVKEHDPIGNKRKHGAARMEDTEGPKRLGSGAWGRRQGLAGLRDDAPSEARGTDGERSARGAADGKRAARSAADGKRVARSAADGKRVARGAGFETTRRAKLTARTPSGQLTARTASRRAKPTARGADAEQAGRRPRAPTRRTRAYNEAGTRRAKQRRGPRPRETVRPGGPP